MRAKTSDLLLQAPAEYKGKTALGIYELEGDTLKLCYSQPGKDRPKEFTAAKGSGQAMSVWKRDKK